MKLPKWATTVTTFSKTLALIIFITFPILGFWLGMEYQYLKNIKEEDKTSLANPASVYCQDQGGKSKIITDPDGSQRGNCIFSNGRSCEEWQFFRTKICKP
jgi:putative hemolysin